MTKKEYVESCLKDAISALSVEDLPESIQVGKDFIYPRVAIERIQSAMKADELDYFKS